MCGICGLINKNGRHIDFETLRNMTKQLVHRGPDGEGIHVSNNIGLGHRRLAVIDLSGNARQPMSNEDKTVWIVFNGMIYNYRDLRLDLEKKGHKFISHSDTETIIHLYEEKGDNCVNFLRGMFAFALWDEPKKKLILARDRIGQKPLVYLETKDYFIFASEPKAIFASGLAPKEMDIDGMHLFFSYMNVPWPHTMYKNVRQLPPASILNFRFGPNSFKIDRYWKPDLNFKLNISSQDASDGVRYLMEESVRLRSMSDVPLGALLSGGLDSSSVVGLMSSFSPKPIETFSIGYQTAEKKDPEFNFSKEIASLFGTNHHQISIDHNIINILPQMLWFYDEPYANPVAMPNFELCRIMKRSLTVALSGDGGDEVFAGYPGYCKWKAVHIFNKSFPLKPLNRFALLAGKNGLIDNAGILLTCPDRKRSFRKNIFSRGIYNSLYSSDTRDALGQIETGKILEDFYLENKSDSLVDNILFMDLVLYNSHGVSLISDISGMANGVEIRAPFLDHKLVEFAFALPLNSKIKWFSQTKHVLRKAVSDLLPKSVLNRKKVGYGEGIPFDSWFRKEWNIKVKQYLFEGGMADSNLFEMGHIKRLYDDHLKKKRDNFNILWSLICFSVWYDNVFKRN